MGDDAVLHGHRHPHRRAVAAAEDVSEAAASALPAGECGLIPKPQLHNVPHPVLASSSAPIPLEPLPVLAPAVLPPAAGAGAARISRQAAPVLLAAAAVSSLPRAYGTRVAAAPKGILSVEALGRGAALASSEKGRAHARAGAAVDADAKLAALADVPGKLATAASSAAASANPSRRVPFDVSALSARGDHCAGRGSSRSRDAAVKAGGGTASLAVSVYVGGVAPQMRRQTPAAARKRAASSPGK